MILINLLPSQYRAAEKRAIKLPYKKFALAVFVIFLGFCLYNLFIFLKLREKNRVLEKKWAPLAQSSMQAESLERELGMSILGEVDFYNSSVDPAFKIAQIMNEVSDLIPDNLWLSKFEFNRESKEIQLVLNGFAESTEKSSNIVEIQNFGNSLKDEFQKVIKTEGSEASQKTSAPILPPTPFLKEGLLPFTNKQKSIGVEITTSSQGGTNQETVQFVAILKSDGYQGQKK